MAELIYYNSVNIFHRKYSSIWKEIRRVPGVACFAQLFNLFAPSMTLLDRSGTLRLPIKTHMLPFMELPRFEPFGKTLDEICLERARELMDQVKAQGKKLALMYSGGVDSTLLIIALIRACGEEEVKKHSVVLLSNESIGENPGFYYNWLLKGFVLEPSYKFPTVLGNDDYLFVTGENADQLFGSAIMGEYVRDNGINSINARLEPDKIVDFITRRIRHGRRVAESLFLRLNKVVRRAPIPIDTPYKFFWWLNFILKWQSVYVRVISFTPAGAQATVRPEVNYTTFYHPPQFQLWAMNHSNELIRDTWESYKYVAKDIIYEFTKDAAYRDRKVKVGSLGKIVTQKEAVMGIDGDLRFLESFVPTRHLTMDNDFIDQWSPS